MMSHLAKPFAIAISMFGAIGLFSTLQANQGFAIIAESAVSAVMNISATQNSKTPHNCDCPQEQSSQPFDDLEEQPSDFNDPIENFPKAESCGSGFVIQSDQNSAFIVTNYHVIADADKISIFLNDHTELDATILGIDMQADLAVLKVKTSHLPKDCRKLTSLTWADSNLAKVGDFILAVGNSLGLGHTVSHGIISNLSREISTPQSRKEYRCAFIQHSAPIHRGNSGGPLLNLDGKVVGINTAIFSPNGENVGIGFSIPSKVAKERIHQLIEFGRIRSGWLGIKTQNLSGDEFDEQGLDKGKSYKIVSSVSPFGPGAKALIKPGDVILEFDNQEVTSKTRFAQMISDTPVGKAVKIKLWRAGHFITVEAILEEHEAASHSLPPLPTQANFKMT